MVQSLKFILLVIIFLLIYRHLAFENGQLTTESGYDSYTELSNKEILRYL